MSKISGKETKPEIIVRKYLFSLGFRYRKNVKELPGKPDIVLPKYKTVVFIHGCFWHSHEGCSRADLPVTNREFWTEKIQSNVERDRLNQEKLKQQGWKVLIIWQCKLKSIKDREETLNNLVHDFKRKKET